MTPDDVALPLPWWRDPSVMVPWCEAVGLDAARVAANDFVLAHDGDGHTHVAGFTIHDEDGHPVERRLMVVTLLPVECPDHPDTPFVMRRNR